MTEMHDEGSASIERAAALRPSVPLYRHMIYSSGLTNPLDFLILAHIHFMCEDGKTFTVADLVEALRAEGIRNSNGKGDGLIGSKAIYESVARLRAAGFLHRVQANGGSFGKVAYTFYEFPAADPNWSPPSSPDSTVNIPVPLTGEAVPTSNSVSAGRTASPHKGSADKGSADRRSGKRRVSAGRTASPHKGSGDASPPHPPEEEVTTSSSSDKRAPAAPGRTVTDEQQAEAVTFLMRLPNGFALGRRPAQHFAAEFYETVTDNGWKLDLALRLYLTRNEPGKKPPTNYPATLKYRVREMQPRDAVLAAADESKAPESPAAVAGIPVWCGKCGDGIEAARFNPRFRTDTGAATGNPCPDCHPASLAARQD